MRQVCPRCGSEIEFDERAGGDSRACASCGAESYARRTGDYDGYAVGRRVLKFAPAWLLLLFAGFAAALLFFSWASRPVGRKGNAEEDEFRNEATNRTAAQASPTPTRDEQKRDSGARADPGGAAARPSAGEGEVAGAGTDARGEGGVSSSEESASFSVQVGAFGDRSQANEQVSRLRAAGFDARVLEAEDSRRFRFQVRSGLFPTREEAARLAAQLRSKGFRQTVIVEPEGSQK